MKRILFHRTDVRTFLGGFGTESGAGPARGDTGNEPVLWYRLVHHPVVDRIADGWFMECRYRTKRKGLLRDGLCVKHVRGHRGTENTRDIKSAQEPEEQLKIQEPPNRNLNNKTPAGRRVLHYGKAWLRFSASGIGQQLLGWQLVGLQFGCCEHCCLFF